MTIPTRRSASSTRFRRFAALALLFVAAVAGGQTPSPSATAASDMSNGREALASLAWLEGCWKGKVEQREFTERWGTAPGDAMRGTSRMVIAGVSQGDDALRLEARADGLFYVITPAGRSEESFRFVGRTVDAINGRNDEIFTFENPALSFPQRISYRHTAGGALYAEVAGKVNGAERTVIYPMSKVECPKP
jgi:hypothetical protein